MYYLLLSAAVLFCTVQRVCSKQYTRKAKHPNMILYASFSAFFAMLFFVFGSGFDLSFNSEILPYALSFALFYAMGTVGSALAISCGPLSVSALFSSYSLLIPTAYALFFLRETPNRFFIPGLICLITSIFLINRKQEEMKFSAVWVLYILLSFIGNGMCSTVLKIHQTAFGGAYKHEFMIVALLTAAVSLFAWGIWRGKGEKNIIDRVFLKYGFLYGIASGALNLSVMVLAGKIANSVLFPSISAGGITLTFFLSLFVYREKLSRIRTVGYMLGIMAILLLNI